MGHLPNHQSWQDGGLITRQAQPEAPFLPSPLWLRDWELTRGHSPVSGFGARAVSHPWGSVSQKPE